MSQEIVNFIKKMFKDKMWYDWSFNPFFKKLNQLFS